MKIAYLVSLVVCIAAILAGDLRGWPLLLFIGVGVHMVWLWYRQVASDRRKREWIDKATLGDN